MNKIITYLTLLCVCLLCGCSNHTETIFTPSEVNQGYKKYYYDCGMAMNEKIEDIFFDVPDRVVFSTIEVDKDGKSYLEYYWGNAFSNDFYQQTGIVMEYRFSVINTTYYDAELKQNLICLMEQDDEGMICVNKYTYQGDCKGTITFSADMLEGRHINSYRINKDGRMFLLTHDCLYQYTEDDEIVKYEYLNDVFYEELLLVEQKPCCIVREKNSENEQRQRAILFNLDGKIERSIEVPAHGSLFAYFQDIFFYDDKCIYKMDKGLNAYDKIMDFSNETSFINKVIAVVSHNEQCGIIYKSLSDGAYRTVLFDISEAKSPEQEEIYIYDPTGVMEYYCLDDIINSFNETNQFYQVCVKEYDRDLNYVLLSDDKPDLIFLTETGISTLGNAGYIEDLMPSLTGDMSGLEDELIDELTQKLMVSDSLYAIPRMVEICTLCGCEAKVGGNGGWTTTEFLDWLVANPDALRESWIGHLTLLKYCMEEGLNQFVDWEKREADFDSIEFSNMLQTIKDIEINQQEGYISAEKGDIKCLTFNGMGDLLRKRYQYDHLICKGFPTEDGEVKHILKYKALSIFKESKNKEGAFEFIKYYVQYRYGGSMGFFTDKANFEKAAEINEKNYWPIEGNDDLVSVGPDEIKMFHGLFKDSEITKMDTAKMINMILEEANYYFNDQKNIDAVTKVIQNRIQLLLNEM